ncbi:MAG: hypothetical protein FJ363_07880 [Gemmatimonadetes bacterium]|nr:hypothetical protein [Gemmatimonadota bacterium]
MSTTGRPTPDAAALPRVLLVTDADLSPGSRGAGRTLVNLFSRYPADRLLALSANAAAPFTWETAAQVLPAAPRIPGRLTKFARPRIGHVDAAWLAMRPLRGAPRIRAFRPEVVVAVPTHPMGVALAEQCRAFAPLVTYLMDDWLAFEPGVPLAFDTQRRGRELLRTSAAWLSISPYLLASTREFAGADRPAHVVHNPVPLGDGEPAALGAPRTETFRVAYAGSVWPMHWDAVAAVAQGVQRLRGAGADIEFVLFTDRFFWGRHESDWRRWGVVDGGLVPYAELGTALGGCDLLLVASSFESSQAHMSRSSIQTKVTDYMAAGRPILACGPADAASNRFLREHGCALFAEDPAPGAIDGALKAAVAARDEGPQMARRAWDVVRSEHELVAVTDRLYAFLADAASGHRPG